MPTLFEIQTVTRQFFRVESELSVLKAMVRELVLGNAPPVAGPPQKDDQIEKGSPLQRIAALEDRATMLEHDATDAAGRIDALEKSKAPTPANGTLNVPDARSTVTDRTVGLSGEG